MIKLGGPPPIFADRRRWNPVSQRTPLPKTSELSRRWIVVDADGKVLGRLATQVARHLTGKTKPYYTPFLDTGDFVVVVNAEKVVLTGRKEGAKVYRRHTGFPGGLKEVVALRMRSEHPERLIETAVQGMLPKTKLGRKMIKKLKVYAGPHHPHAAQAPAAATA
jgi:large subunit ribosomal protein L13